MTQRLDAIEAGLSAIEATLCGIDARAMVGVMIMCLGLGGFIGVILVLKRRTV